MTGQELEQWYIEKTGSLKEVKTLTDLIAKGKTLIYGASGAGKTYSTIRHLNRSNITPLLIDFDNNCKIDNLEFNFVGGAELLKELRNNSKQEVKVDQTLVDKLKEEREQILKNKLQELHDDDRYTGTDNMAGFMIDEAIRNDKKFDKDIVNIEMKINEAKSGKRSEKVYMWPRSQVVIIDTCAKALIHFSEFSKFEIFINMLLQFGNDVILIAHSHNQGNKQVPDLDEVFSNHCDCKLKLTRDITKTKGEEVYLTVEKLRGYKGETIIKNWER